MKSISAVTSVLLLVLLSCACQSRDPASAAAADPAAADPAAAAAAPATADPAASLDGFADDALAVPVFSAAAGWYAKPFELALSCPEAGAEIRYTLDGSEPTPASSRYGRPLAVRDRSPEAEVLAKIRSGMQPLATDGRIFKATVVRARAFLGKSMSRTVTATYLVDPKGPGRFSFPVISLSVAAPDFFDYVRGIYVPGKIFDERYDPAKQSWEQQGNYTQSGDDWERPVYLEFFETDGARVLAQDAGARLHGGANRGNPQKALRLYARPRYKGDPKDFEYAVFPGLADASGAPLAEFRRLILRPSGNDAFYSFFRDALMTSLTVGTGLDVQAFRPAVVLLSGEYWGIHNIRERLDEYCLADRYGLDKDDIVILENDGLLAVGEPGDEQHFLDLIAYLKANDPADPAVYREIGTRMDLDNYLEYAVAQIYFGNRDWPGNNLRFWRTRTAADGPDAGRADGRWRWLLYDTDFGFGLYKGPEGAEDPSLAAAVQPGLSAWPNPDWSTLLLRTLLRNGEFRAAFINRFADRMNGAYSTAAATAAVDRFQALYAPEMAEHIRRWRAPGSVGQWQGQVQALRVFAARRPDAMKRQLEAMFAVKRAKLAMEWEPSGGSVALNSLKLAGGVHALDYFASVPIRLEAAAAPGYRFAGWDVAEAGAAVRREAGPELVLILSGDASVRPVFEAAGR